MSRRSTRVLITGASGQLARRATELVLETVPGERLILVTRNPSALDELAARGVDVRRGDFADPPSLKAAFAGANRMLLVSVVDLEHRIALHRAAIEAAAAAGIQHVIYTSGLAPAPPNPAVVAPSHYATEQMLKASRMHWTILRNSLYADYQTAELARAAASGQLVHNWGEGRVAHVARADCAAAAAAVLRTEGHEEAVYDITGPEPYSAAELARVYSQLSGTPIEPVALGDTELIARLIGDATDDDHLKYGAALVASFGRSIREGYMASCTDAVERLTGRRARPLRDVLEAPSA